MRKKFLYALALVFTLVCPAVSYAQMTDTQIVEYVKKQVENGVDEKTIAKELLAKGVTIEQLQKLRTKYENMNKNAQKATPNELVESSIRIINGETDPIEEEEQPESNIFGHNIFRSEFLKFSPNMNIPTPSDYVLGAGDEVIVDIYGSSQITASCTISPEGSISIPDEGPIYISGLTKAKAQDKIRATIGSHYMDSEIRLTIGQTRTITIHVLGEVRTPGSYNVSAFATVFNALYLSGGVNEIGTLRDVQVSRGGKTIAHVDIYDMILNGNLKGDIALRDNDVIRVNTYDNLVKIDGKVKRPMFYEMKSDESLADLITYAGGFTGDAYRDKIRVERTDVDGMTVFNIKERDMASFRTHDGDSVFVLPSLQRFHNTVAIEGAVFRPGNYRMGDDVRTVKQLVEQAGGLTEKAVTELAVLLRMRENRTLETLPVRLYDILYGGAADITLKNEDKLVIASTELRDSLQTVTIVGEVFTPGQKEFSVGETVATLVTRAGGLRESADPQQIEIARRITQESEDPDGKTTAKIFHVDINSDMQLMPYDIVTIVRSSHYKEQKSVTIIGEVYNAGTYVLATSEERLSSLIERAGGLTPNAFVGGVQITRTMTTQERKLLQIELEQARTEEDSIRIQTALKKTTYTIGTDLAAALKEPGSTKDLIIKEYDVIVVPQANNTVKISGAVLSPNTVNYEDGHTLSYYLNQAGGVSRQGHRSQAYILYANGKKSKASRGKVQPGCEIVVPAREKREFNPQVASVVLSAASVTATVAAVIVNVLRK